MTGAHRPSAIATFHSNLPLYALSHTHCSKCPLSEYVPFLPLSCFLHGRVATDGCTGTVCPAWFTLYRLQIVPKTNHLFIIVPDKLYICIFHPIKNRNTQLLLRMYKFIYFDTIIWDCMHIYMYMYLKSYVHYTGSLLFIHFFLLYPSFSLNSDNCAIF